MLKDEGSRGLSEKGSRCGYRWSLPAADCAAVAGRCDDKIIVLRQGRLLTPRKQTDERGLGLVGSASRRSAASWTGGTPVPPFWALMGHAAGAAGRLAVTVEAVQHRHEVA